MVLSVKNWKQHQLQQMQTLLSHNSTWYRNMCKDGCDYSFTLTYQVFNSSLTVDANSEK